MTFNEISNYFAQYGVLILFVIVFLEYMNLPGLPAGIIMPAAGIFVAKGEMNLLLAIALSVLAGLLGSLVLYGLGRWGGDLVLNKYFKKFPKHEDCINKNLEMLKQKGHIGIFISKLIPMVRTLIGIPAGMLKMKLSQYIIYSTLGILVWNSALIGAGYFFGDKIITMF